ncbi:caspase domain-containing protein [Armillaria nabsnona]|nr:caspase domain-containing protein [Armillaria nabsnona]
MAPGQMFALIVGIDKYKSGSIWDLDSCVSDARRMNRWLMGDLRVPKENIRLLLDTEATKAGIETAFLSHLVNNPSIQRGDAILIYFAGHGSVMPSPPDWYSGILSSRKVHMPPKVQVLCPYDHDTKGPEGRIAGLSDRSLKALIRDVSQAKGDNITLIVDSSFTPPLNIRDRRHIRWTSTHKATPDDLRASLWQSAHGHRHETSGFHDAQTSTHTLVTACGPDQRAVEGKHGGRFTSAFLEAVKGISLHRTSYDHLVDRILTQAGEDLKDQHPICIGPDKTRFIFDATSFPPDDNYISIDILDTKADHFRVQVGPAHGIFNGDEMSIHSHNFSGPYNPSIGTVVVTEVHPTWCLVRRRTNSAPIGTGSWVRVNHRRTRSNSWLTTSSVLLPWTRGKEGEGRRSITSKPPHSLDEKSLISAYQDQSPEEGLIGHPSLLCRCFNGIF